jgi:hypothetical protein
MLCAVFPAEIPKVRRKFSIDTIDFLREIEREHVCFDIVTTSWRLFYGRELIDVPESSIKDFSRKSEILVIQALPAS